MSEHPNLLLIQSFFTAYAGNDLEAMRQILSPDIEWVIPGRNPTCGVKTGIDQVLAYFKQLQAFGFKARPIVMGVNDDFVIDCHLNWSNLAKGKNIEKMSCLLWQFKGGMISKVYNFPEDQHLIDAFFNRELA